MIYIDCPYLEIGQSRIEIFNRLGELVISLESNENHLTIPLMDFNSGVYFVKLTQNGDTEIKKIIKWNK